MGTTSFLKGTDENTSSFSHSNARIVHGEPCFAHSGTVVSCRLCRQWFIVPPPQTSQKKFASFDYYRQLIKNLGSDLGFSMSVSDMNAFVQWHRARAGEEEPLLPRLRDLSLSFRSHQSRRTAMGLWHPVLEPPPQPPRNSIACTLILLDIIFHGTITGLTLDIDGTGGKQQWAETRTIVHAKLESLLEICALRTFTADLTEDVPRSVADHLCTESLRQVDLKFFVTSGEQLHGLNALWTALSGLNNVRTLALRRRVMKGVNLGAGFPNGLVPMAQGTFPALRTLQFYPADFLGAIPLLARHHLTTLKLELNDHDPSGLRALSECITSCPNLRDLALAWRRMRTRGGGDACEFPWHAVYSLSNLSSLGVKDDYYAVDCPKDADLKLLGGACPGLQSMSWEQGWLPLDPFIQPAASLNGLIALATCPLRFLNIPIRVEGPHTEVPSRRFTTQSLCLGYGQWSYTQLDCAAGWIQECLKGLCPLQRTIQDWVEIDHPECLMAQGRRDVKAMWENLRNSHE